MKLELQRSRRSKWSWTYQNEARAADIMAVLAEFDQYLPMTLRQLFYQLLHYTDAPHWKQKRKGQAEPQPVDVYSALGRTLKWMRIDGRINRDVIIDEHRILTIKAGYSSPEDFIDSQLYRLGRGYSRCNAQKQPRHIEVWLEKAALLRLVEPVADQYCRRVVVCKGYNSVTFQTQFYDRAMQAIGYGMVPTVLYLGDWDPSGENMLHAAVQTLQDELGLDGVEYYRCGLNPEHFGIIQKNPVPIKPSDSRSKKFIAKYGDVAYELDALHPEQLKTLVRDSIIGFTDMSAYQENKEIEQADYKNIAAWGEQVKYYAYELAKEI